jgi:hypothetical protein
MSSKHVRQDPSFSHPRKGAHALALLVIVEPPHDRTATPMLPLDAETLQLPRVLLALEHDGTFRVERAVSTPRQHPQTPHPNSPQFGDSLHTTALDCVRDTNCYTLGVDINCYTGVG